MDSGLDFADRFWRIGFLCFLYFRSNIETYGGLARIEAQGNGTWANFCFTLPAPQDANKNQNSA